MRIRISKNYALSIKIYSFSQLHSNSFNRLAWHRRCYIVLVKGGDMKNKKNKNTVVLVGSSRGLKQHINNLLERVKQ